MFELLAGRAAAAAERRADARAEEIAQALGSAVPDGVSVRRTEAGVEIRGRGIARRFALEPALRWLTGGVR